MPKLHSKKMQTLAIFLLVVAICVTAMGWWGYAIAAGQIRSEVQQAYQLSLLRTKERIDSYFRQLDQAINQSEKVPQVQLLLMRTSEEPESSELLGLYDLLVRMQTTIDHVDNIMLYKPAVQKTYSTNLQMTEFHAGYQTLLDEFNRLDTSHAFMNTESNGTPTAVFVRKLPLFSSTPTVYVLFHINQKFFDDMLGSQAIDQRGSYFLLDKNERLIESRGSVHKADLQELAGRLISAEEGSPGRFMKDEQLVVTHLPPSINGWTYGFAIPENALLDKLNALRRTLLLLATALFASAGITAVISANRLWRGWGNITRLLENDADAAFPTSTVPTAHSGSDEFERIYQQMMRITTKRDALEHQMRSIGPEIRDAFLRGLMEKGLRTESDRAKCKTYLPAILERRYVCFCVEIDHYKTMIDYYSDFDLSVFRYGVNAVIAEVVDESGAGFSLETADGRMLALLAISPGSQKVASEIRTTVASRISRFVGEHFPFTVSVGISRLRSDLSHLNVSRREAEDALRHRLLAGINQIMTIEQASGDAELPVLPFSFDELENDLLYAIRSLNRNVAHEAVGRLRLLQGAQGLSSQLLQARLSSLVYTLYREAAKGLPQPPTLPEPNMAVLLELSTLEEWMEWIQKSCIEPIIMELETKHNAHMQHVFEQIARYIEQHLSEDQRIETCCKTLGLPVTLAKQALKEAGDTTYTEYVLSARIERAKLWLIETDLSIEAIAERLQYSNAQNFSRTFKRLVSVPPGQYRREHQH